MSTVRRSLEADAAAPSPLSRRGARHDNAIIQAEVRRLSRALAPYGILHRDLLRKAADAESWRDGGFEGALAAAVREGVVEELPGDFFRDPRPPHAA